MFTASSFRNTAIEQFKTEYTTLQENVLNSGTDNPYMDEETRQYFKTKSREITELIQQKLPKRYRVIPDENTITEINFKH